MQISFNLSVTRTDGCISAGSLGSSLSVRRTGGLSLFDLDLDITRKMVSGTHMDVTLVLSDEHAGIIYVFIEPGGVLVFLSVSHIELWHDPACVDCVQQVVAYTLHSTLCVFSFLYNCWKRSGRERGVSCVTRYCVTLLIYHYFVSWGNERAQVKGRQTCTPNWNNLSPLPFNMIRYNLSPLST